MARMAQRTCPRTMVKYRGNKPAKSQPTGIELELMFVTKVAYTLGWISLRSFGKLAKTHLSEACEEDKGAGSGVPVVIQDGVEKVP
jgi:hypothetical protein